MAARAPRAEFGVGDELERELHVLGREGLAVVPADIVTQANAPGETVLRNAAVLLARHFDRKIGLKNALGVHSKERIKHREMHASSTSVCGISGLKTVGSCESPTMTRPVGLAGRSLREGGLAQQIGCDKAGGAACRHQSQRVAPRVVRFGRLKAFGHWNVPLVLASIRRGS